MVRKIGSKVVEIIPATDARFSRLPISKLRGKSISSGGNYVMRLIPILHTDIKTIQSSDPSADSGLTIPISKNTIRPWFKKI